VASEGGNFWPYVLAGLVYYLLVLAWPLRRFHKEVY
jgi:hypothetical protein